MWEYEVRIRDPKLYLSISVVLTDPGFPKQPIKLGTSFRATSSPRSARLGRVTEELCLENLVVRCSRTLLIRLPDRCPNARSPWMVQTSRLYAMWKITHAYTPHWWVFLVV